MLQSRNFSASLNIFLYAPLHYSDLMRQFVKKQAWGGGCPNPKKLSNIGPWMERLATRDPCGRLFLPLPSNSSCKETVHSHAIASLVRGHQQRTRGSFATVLPAWSVCYFSVCYSLATYQRRKTAGAAA